MFEVYLESTPDAIFDEARVKHIAKRLMNYLIATRGPDHIDDYEDYTQVALIKLWDEYSKDPNTLMGYSDGRLYSIAKGYCRNAMKSAYERKCRHYHTKGQKNGPKTVVKRMFTVSELVANVESESQMEMGERLLARGAGSLFTQDSSQVREADTRLDLEKLLKDGLSRLKGRQLHEVKILIREIAEGYSQMEIARRNGWTENRVRTVMRLMRCVFIEVATGKKREPCEGITRPQATAHEIERVQTLRAQGLSYRKIGAMIGRSAGFVVRNCA